MYWAIGNWHAEVEAMDLCHVFISFKCMFPAIIRHNKIFGSNLTLRFRNTLLGQVEYCLA